jgi:hypothetical protein
VVIAPAAQRCITHNGFVAANGERQRVRPTRCERCSAMLLLLLLLLHTSRYAR